MIPQYDLRNRVGLSLAIGWIWTSAALGQDPLFGPAVHYATGAGPYSVAIGDLNGDRVPDLAVANAGPLPGTGRTVSVLLGLGHGTFAAAVHYVAGEAPLSVAIGDLDGDQVPDLAVANGYGGISMHMGIGDGTFAAARHYAAGDGPAAVAIGDLNGDQVPDLAVANSGGRNVSVLVGLGGGIFAAPLHYAAGNLPYSVALGDLNGDRVLDLAVANLYSSTVSVLVGVGDGTFAAALHYPAGSSPWSVTIGDLDGDQVPDLAVAISGSSPDPGHVSVLLGLGDGTFAAALRYPAGNGPVSVAIGDLNRDELPDLAVANLFSDNVSVLLGAGNGTFAAPLHYVAGDGAKSVAIADLDGDQAPDLAVVNYYSDNVAVLLNQRGSLNGDLNCDGSFNGGDIDPFFLALGNPAQYQQQFPNCDILLGDMNCDGRVDGGDIDEFFRCLGIGGCSCP